MEKKLESVKRDSRIEHYPKTELFSVIYIVGVPHFYYVTDKHVHYASEHFGGILNTNSIRDAEKNGVCCDICRKSKNKVLTVDEHKTALLVNCKSDNKEKLQEYLLLIKPMCEKDGHVGFVLKKGW